MPLGMLDAEDRNGETLADVLYKHGFQGSEEALGRTAYPPDAIRGSVTHPPEPQTLNPTPYSPYTIQSSSRTLALDPNTP